MDKRLIPLLFFFALLTTATALASSVASNAGVGIPFLAKQPSFSCTLEALLNGRSIPASFNLTAITFKAGAPVFSYDLSPLVQAKDYSLLSSLDWHLKCSPQLVVVKPTVTPLPPKPTVWVTPKPTVTPVVEIPTPFKPPAPTKTPVATDTPDTLPVVTARPTVKPTGTPASQVPPKPTVVVPIFPTVKPVVTPKPTVKPTAKPSPPASGG